MTIDPRDVRRTTADVHFQQVDGPPRYAKVTAGPVRVATVANPLGTLGYLWAADADDAAGFVANAAAGSDGSNAAVTWARKLREAKADGLAPSQALARLAGDPGNDQTGRVVPGSEGQASSLDELKALAGNR
jgi:hypothetical protein